MYTVSFYEKEKSWQKVMLRCELTRAEALKIVNDRENQGSYLMYMNDENGNLVSPPGGYRLSLDNTGNLGRHLKK